MTKMTFEEYDALCETLETLPHTQYVPNEHELKELVKTKEKHPEIKDLEFLIYCSECGYSKDKENVKNVRRYISQNLEITDSET